MTGDAYWYLLTCVTENIRIPIKVRKDRWRCANGCGDRQRRTREIRSPGEGPILCGHTVLRRVAAPIVNREDTVGLTMRQLRLHNVKYPLVQVVICAHGCSPCYVFFAAVTRMNRNGSVDDRNGSLR